MSTVRGIYGLSEGDKNAIGIYKEALGKPFESIQHIMHEFGDAKLNTPQRDYRSPLLVRFKHKKRKLEFQVVLNHLARGNKEFRKQQAGGLREWARNRTVPTIGIGDFNFDYDFQSQKGNDSFTEFMRDNVWQWISPEQLIDTNWADRNGDRQDDYPGSMLDFTFVAGPAKELKWKSQVITWAGDFPDNKQTSDHRPVVLSVSLLKFKKLAAQ